MISDPDSFVSLSASEGPPTMTYSPAIAPYLDNFDTLVVMPCGGVVGEGADASETPAAIAPRANTGVEASAPGPDRAQACDRALDRLLRFSTILLFGAATLYLVVNVQRLMEPPTQPQPSPAQPHSPMM